MSDQYWIAPSESNISWSEVNFFENSFSKDVGNVLLGENIDNKTIDLMSPDNTSDGWLKKKWEIIIWSKITIPIVFVRILLHQKLN